MEAQAKLEDEEHHMRYATLKRKLFITLLTKELSFPRLQILHDLLDAVSGNSTDTETNLNDDTAQVVQDEELSDETTETDEMTSS